MNTAGSYGRSSGIFRKSLGAIPVLATVVLLSACMPAIASGSEPPALDAGDAKCLKCHSKNPKKTLEDGENLPLHVEASEFTGSVHSGIGCVGCHVEIAGKKHPVKRAIVSRHDFSLEQNQHCETCHADKFAGYKSSIHASLVSEGVLDAPMCTDCHGVHGIQPMEESQTGSGLPCRNCHEDIFTAYAQSVHGEARSRENTMPAGGIQAPACSDCHQAHEVSAVAAGDRLKAACLDCHEDVESAHGKWLPNAGLHMEVVSCAACHAPLAERGIDLELYHALSTEPVSSGPPGARVPDQSETDLTAQEWLKQAKESGPRAQTSDIALRGRMRVRNGIEAHQLAIKESAVRDCETCHQKGSIAFGDVTVSVSGPDGRRQYFEADREILSSVDSVPFLGDFYVIGGTRIRLLDALLVLALVAGLAIPIGHFAVGRLLGKGKLEKASSTATRGDPNQAGQAIAQPIYINPLPVRIWHWINALGFVLLILTGAQLRYIDLFGIMSFETAVKLHNWTGFVVIGSYFLWLGFHLFTDKISNYQPVLDPQTFLRNFLLQARYYGYGIFKGEHSPHKVRPEDKFNPMQRMTYQMVMLVAAPIQFVTGLMLWNVKAFSGWIDTFGGIRVVSTVHVLLFIFFAAFILVHAYMGALGQKPSTHFKEMFTGFEEPED